MPCFTPLPAVSLPAGASRFGRPLKRTFTAKNRSGSCQMAGKGLQISLRPRKIQAKWLEIDSESLQMHFGSPEMYFEPPEIDFKPLQIDFESPETHFEPSSMYFGSPEMPFKSLETSFEPLCGDPRVSGGALKGRRSGPILRQTASDHTTPRPGADSIGTSCASPRFPV